MVRTDEIRRLMDDSKRLKGIKNRYQSKAKEFVTKLKQEEELAKELKELQEDESRADAK